MIRIRALSVRNDRLSIRPVVRCRHFTRLLLLLSISVFYHTVIHAQCLTDLTDTKPYTLTQSGQAASFPATNAFNNANDAFDGWEESRNPAVGNEGWLRVSFTTGAQVAKGYSITAMDNFGTGANIAPRNWKFQGFTGAVWVTLDVRSNITFTDGQTRIFSFNNVTAYSTYRLFISETGTTTSTTVGLAELQIFQDVCLTGRVFKDNGDRAPAYNSTNDIPLNGVTVSIVNETLGTVVASTTTNASGVYLFDNTKVPAAGNFSVIVTPPAGKNFVTESSNLLNSLVTLPSPEEEPSSGAVFFDYHQNQQATFSAVTNRMLFPGGNLDFGLKDATASAALVCAGGGSVGTNLITAANNGSFGIDAGTWTTEQPHQKGFTVAASTLYSSLPVANTSYTFVNTLANIGTNNSGLLYNEGYYTVTSYLGTISDYSDQPYLSSLLNSYNGYGFRKTYGANAGDVHDKFLAVNGSSTAGVPFFQQTGIALTGGTSYSFSFFGKQANSYGQVVGIGSINNAPVLAQITNNAGSVVATSTITLTAPTAYTQDRPETPWQFGTVSFVAPSTGGPFTVSLSATSSAVAGNDFYIDNITLTPCSAVILLPLDIRSFTASCRAGGDVQLQWEIENPEQGSTVVEYSNDGTHFEAISNVPMQAGVTGYHFLHTTSGQAYNYYRLMIVTDNGRTIYSDVQKISLAGRKESIVLYPNPVNGILYISGMDDLSRVEITDASGKIVFRQNMRSKSLSLSTAGWKPGFYFVKIAGGNTSSLHKVVVVK